MASFFNNFHINPWLGRSACVTSQIVLICSSAHSSVLVQNRPIWFCVNRFATKQQIRYRQDESQLFNHQSNFWPHGDLKAVLGFFHVLRLLTYANWNRRRLSCCRLNKNMVETSYIWSLKSAYRLGRKCFMWSCMNVGQRVSPLTLWAPPNCSVLRFSAFTRQHAQIIEENLVLRNREIPEAWSE